MKEKEQIFVDMDNFVEIMKSTDKYIYHYTTAEIAKNYILPNGTIKFSNISNLNDPEEINKFESLFIDNTINEQNSEINETSDKLGMLMYFRSIFPKRILSSSFCTDKKEAIEFKGNNYFETIKHHLTKGFMLSRMWGTYGDKHKGVCLCFDKEKLLKLFIESKPSFCEIYSQKVNYSKDIMEHLEKFSTKNSPLGIYPDFTSFEELEEKIISKKDFLFFYKQDDWRDENEFKIILLNDDDKEEFYLPFKDALVSIFMGDKFSLGKENNVFKHFCASYNVSAFRIHYTGGSAFARPFNFNYI